ncbi:NADH-quinone oxidoreductase subunit J [Candidatus Bathyarchaeota archaeon]|nr:NADH-quinone oxidoreductase subunit J [Candidatus Bathyarchaeota archaeon]
MIELIILLSLTVLSAFLAVSDPNIVYGVIFLLCTNILLGIIYYMLGAPMASLFQLAIFAGAIVVFFIITVMLTRGGEMQVEEEAEE